jgi:hypothetical protein
MSDSKAIWMFSDDDEYWPYSERFETRQEAIDSARESLDLTPGDHFYTATEHVPDLKIWASPFVADHILVDVEERISDEFCLDYLGDWPNASIPAKHELEAALWNVLVAWLKKHNQWPPPWYLATNVQEHTAA